MGFMYEPPKPDRKVRVTHAKDPVRESKGAIEHLSKGWLPVNPKLYRAIQESIRSGAYQEQPEKLLHDIKQDPGILFHSLKKLGTVSEDTDDSKNPLEILAQLEHEKLEEIFAPEPGELSLHRIHSATPTQVKQLQYTLFSSNAAEKIAEKALVNPDLAFSTSSLKQLGLYLIAWNYPTIYIRVLSAHRIKGVNMDQELHRMLGLSPLEIGQRFASQWGMNSQIKRNLKTKPLRESHLDDTDESDVLSLHDICEIAELYAKLQDPETFPKAEEIWRANENRLNHWLDEETILKINNSVKAACMMHLDATAEIKRLPIIKSAEKTQKKSLHKDIVENTYLNRCPPYLVELFEEVYRQLAENRATIDAIRTLVDTVIPAAGFVRGCLYLLDQNSLELKPALRIGRVPLERYGPFLLNDRNGIMASLHSSFPLKKEDFGIMGQKVDQICGPIQNGKHPGVLYLEIDVHRAEDPAHDAGNYFRAICKAINACFKEADERSAKIS